MFTSFHHYRSCYKYILYDLFTDANSNDAIPKHYGDVMRNILDVHRPNVTMEMANRVYLAKHFEVQNSYTNAIQNHFGGNFERVDFKEQDKVAKV